MIYQLRPVGAGYGGSKKTNNESKDSERSQKWLIRNPRLWRSPPPSSRSWQVARHRRILGLAIVGIVNAKSIRYVDVIAHIISIRPVLAGRIDYENRIFSNIFVRIDTGANSNALIRAYSACRKRMPAIILSNRWLYGI